MEPARLTILPFLSDWAPATTRLTLNVMTIPVGDPRDPLAAASPAATPAPAFLGSAITLVPHISTDPLTVPTLAGVPAGSPAIPLTAPAGQAAIFADLAAQFSINQPQQAFERKAAFRLAKYLPNSYRRSFAFVAPKTALAVIDDSYLCALRCPPKTPLTPATPSVDVSWGEVFAMLSRHPAMARAAGLLHTITIDLGVPGGLGVLQLGRRKPLRSAGGRRCGLS